MVVRITAAVGIRELRAEPERSTVGLRPHSGDR
jgi:hypothetical protein